MRALVLYRNESTCERCLDELARAGIVGEATQLDASSSPRVRGHQLVLVEARDVREAVDNATCLVSAVDTAVVLVLLPCAPQPEALEEILRAGAAGVASSTQELKREVARIRTIARHMTRADEDRLKVLGEAQQQDRLQALGLLAAGVGHEINNPAGAIMANLQSIRDGLDEVTAGARTSVASVPGNRLADWREAVADSLIAVRQIGEIVDSLRSLSRSNPNAKRELLELNAVINNVARLLRREVSRAGVTLKLVLADGLPPIEGTPSQVYQVLTNLVLNAVQAIEGAGRRGSVTISTEADASLVIVSVADDGPGIAPENVDRIFDPFFTTKLQTGTGLGLFITQSLVRQMGGEIILENRPGAGATFTVTFERREQAGVSDAPRRLLGARPRLRVLLVDDDELVLRAMRRSLKPHFEVVTATGAGEALQLLRDNHDIDAVVCDVVMPGTDGCELFQSIKDNFPELVQSWLFMSGGVIRQDDRDRVAHTGRPLLKKPLEHATLLNTLEANFRGRPRG